MTLAARELTVTLGDHPALHGVSCLLEKGRITAICGPNGAGKSTLLSCLAGLLAPNNGNISLADRDLATLPARDRAKAIGYLPQDGQVAWDLDVRTLVSLGRMPHGDAAGAGQIAVEAALEALDLSRFAERPISRLSGGERARALLARVLAGEPDWILADEPLAALDLAHQLALLARLRQAAADAGVGVVLVLHDLALAMNHADRVLVLKEGALAADGLPRDALSVERIGEVWGVDVRWFGDEGARAIGLAQRRSP